MSNVSLIAMKHLIPIKGSKIIKPGRLYMRFPNKLIVTLKSSVNGTPVPNHAVFLLFRSVRKNDYYVGPRLADNLGQVVFTDKEVKHEINWSMYNMIMAHSDTYEECFTDFYIILFTKNDLQNFLKMSRAYKDKESEKISAKAFELIPQAGNNNSTVQEWNFEADKLTTSKGVAYIECLVDGV